MADVDDLRQQLRERGYLTHGIERWFALDPWSSRTFWAELSIVGLKAATLIAVFGALPLTAVMLFRNQPLGAGATIGLFVTYAAFWVACAFAVVIAIALALKLRPALPIETPRALLAISSGAGSLFVFLGGIWWYAFDTSPSIPELLTGGGLAVLFFIVTTIAVSAALLSFSIYEVHRVPLIQRRTRVIPMSLTAAALVALLFVPALAEREPAAVEPMIVVSPGSQRLALIAVDGLTHEILLSRADLTRSLQRIVPVEPIPGDSTTERWASAGTGVTTERHGVRAIEGVRFTGGSQVIQRISNADFVVRRLLPLIRIARREPLPPTIRRREYVWEILAERGVTAAAVNWWATSDHKGGALTSIGPETIFSAAGADPLRVDSIAIDRFSRLTLSVPRFATVYLPALDVILNRIGGDRSSELAASLRALDALARVVSLARRRGYDVIVLGMPGEGQQGKAVIASTLPFSGDSAWDVAPAVLDAMGFPLSAEMPGGPEGTQRIATYGVRGGVSDAAPLNEEYYQTLKSLGYIQ